MARLPTAQSLGVRSFQDRSSVVTPRVDTSGQDKLVSTIANISQGMNERLDASSLHKAKIHFQKAKLEADSAFDQDPNFETYQERYDKKLEDAMKAASDMVRNPGDKARFSQDMSLYRAQGNQAMMAKAFGKETDKGLADLDETMTIGRENYLRASTQADKDFAVQIINDAIDSAEQATHVDADKAQMLRQKAAVDMAIASVEAAPPEKQVSLLKSNKGVMQYIPLDVRTKMLRNAEGEYSDQLALDTANSIREEGGTLSERMSKVNKITDPKVKSSTRSQVINDHNLEMTAEGQRKYSIYDTAAKGIIAGGSLLEFRKENQDDWNSLGSKEQAALISMTKTKKPTTTNFDTYHKLNKLKIEDKQKAYLFFLENVSDFSESEAKKQDDYFMGLAEEPKPLLSLKETFNKKAKNLKVKGEDLGRAEWRIQQEYDTWIKANPGETMSLNDQSDIVNAVFDEVAESGLFGFGKSRQFEVPRRDADKLKIQKKFDEYKDRFGEEATPDIKEKITAKMVRDGFISAEGYE